MAVNERVEALSEKLYEKMNGDKVTGIVTVEGDPYYENLPENITKEQVDEIDAYNTDYMSGGVVAFGKHFSQLAADNPNLNVFQGELKMSGKNSISVQTDRVKTYPNPSGGDPVEKMGATRVTINQHAAKSSSSQLHKAKDGVSDLFRALSERQD